MADNEVNEEQVQALAQRLTERAPANNAAVARRETQLADARARIRELLDELNAWSVQELEHHIALDGLRNQPDRRDDFEAQMRAILQLPDVDYVQVSRHGVEVFTKKLISVVFKDGKQRVFGRFRITLGWNQEVHVQALDKESVKLDTIEAQQDMYFHYEHPHVYGVENYPYPRENVCWGNMADPVHQFVQEQQYDGAAALIMQFLARVNEDHAGYSVKSWKVYDPNEPELPENVVVDDEPPEEEDPRDPFIRRVAAAVEEQRMPVLDREGNPVPGVQRVVRGRARAQQEPEQQFRWERVTCNGQMLERAGRHGICDTCGKRVLLDARGQLRTHGERRRVAVQR